MVSKAQVDWVMCYGMMECCSTLRGRMLSKSTGGRRQIQLVDSLLEPSIYAVLKKAAKDRSVCRTIKESVTNEWLSLCFD